MVVMKTWRPTNAAHIIAPPIRQMRNSLGPLETVRTMFAAAKAKDIEAENSIDTASTGACFCLTAIAVSAATAPMVARGIPRKSRSPKMYTLPIVYCHRDRTAPHGAALPNHRTYGSRIRRFGWSGQTNVPWRLSSRALGNAIAVTVRCPFGRYAHETLSLTCHSHLPSLLGLAPFRPSMVAIRLGLSVAPPLGLECLTSLA